LDTPSLLRRQFDKFLEPASRGSKRNLYNLFVAALSLAVIVWIAASILVYLGKIDKSGQFGDFVGGTLNPILSFVTFMALLVTIVLQQTELADTRKELAASTQALEAQLKSLDRQNFESTFFQMLSLHNTIVSSIDLTGVQKSSSRTNSRGRARTLGRDCFKYFFANYRDAYEAAYRISDQRRRLQKAYDEFWDRRQQDLAHYYRYLYNVLRFVHDYEGIEDKHRYVKLLRAQLSDFELVLLFYTAVNENGINYWKYIHEFALFDNLPTRLLIDEAHKELYSPQSFGEPRGKINLNWPPAALAREERKRT